MWDKIITIKRTTDLNYFSLCALNLFNTRVSQFELKYWNRVTFPRHSNLLRCTWIYINLHILFLKMVVNTKILDSKALYNQPYAIKILSFVFWIQNINLIEVLHKYMYHFSLVELLNWYPDIIVYNEPFLFQLQKTPKKGLFWHDHNHLLVFVAIS